MNAYLGRQRGRIGVRHLLLMLALGITIGMAERFVTETLGQVSSEDREGDRVKAGPDGLRPSTSRTAPSRLPGTVTLDANAQQTGGIAVQTVRRQAYGKELRAYGTVLNLARLIELANTYAAAKAQQQTAKAKLDASEATYLRARRLYEDDRNVSSAQLQSAEAAFRTDRASLATAEAQLRAIHATARQEWGSVLGNALAEGPGQIVQRLIERRDVLLQVTLPPGVTLLDPPAKAEVELSTERDAGGRRATARRPIRYASPATRTDPRLQSVSFYYLAPGDSPGLLAGMNVSVLLPMTGTTEASLVPESAVVRWQGKTWMYLKTEPQTFVRREVTADRPLQGGEGYIVEDVPAGAEIVVVGAQSLLSEELKSQLNAAGEG